MSFAGSSVADCAVGRNPLSQFAKQVGEDRSSQRDRFGPAAPGASMRTGMGEEMSLTDRDMMEKFMSTSYSPVPQGNGPFGFDAMRKEILNMRSPPPPVMSQSQSPMPVVGESQWAQEFSVPSPSEQTGREDFRQGGMPNMISPMYSGSQFGFGGMPMGGAGGMYSQGPMMYHSQPAPASSAQLKGKGRLVELDSTDWEAQFNSIESENVVDDEDAVREEMADLNDHFTGESFHGDFENIWRGIQEQHMQDGTSEQVGHVSNLDATYENLFAGDKFSDSETNPFGSELKMPWDKDFERFATSRPDSGDYQYEMENKYLEPDVSDPFAEGVRLMESGGNLSEAALAFEAAVQKDPMHVEAWSLLGAVQAQNEKEDPAIRALERAVQLDPDNQVALMSLAVSYINEGYENAAYATLERWIATKYPDLVEQARGQQPQLADVDRFRLHDRVSELFLRAAQISPDGMTMDADVQVGLGVLFYGNEEYDKAVDCFNTALSVRPDDPLLWNRLGATLANSHRSEEAIEAYYKALEIRPSFVRALYNLGVSCINIGCYKEAAQHLLTALEMHRIPNELNTGSEDDILANRSTNLYETLRRVFLAMDRRDLADRTVNGVDPAVFRDMF
ncbi:hypothetical protein V1512DRAFT_226060 [Lipomyces arxii]|uniref:uncharacterized protein n=1 Tax=Lipomyces arxii TaxID=56418 RepID=UPI0034CEE138